MECTRCGQYYFDTTSSNLCEDCYEEEAALRWQWKDEAELDGVPFAEYKEEHGF